MDEKFKQLSELGAGEFEHIDGSLIDHLAGTKSLLESWSASSVLQDAGFYHAAYGTAGFSEILVSTTNREKIAKIIGDEAEAIVYLYCACDRQYVWPKIGIGKYLEFKNRFTGQLYLLTEQQLTDFCELTVANELEIANDNPEFINVYGQSLYKLFKNMHLYLSSQASNAVEAILGAQNAYQMHAVGRGRAAPLMQALDCENDYPNCSNTRLTIQYLYFLGAGIKGSVTNNNHSQMSPTPYIL